MDSFCGAQAHLRDVEFLLKDKEAVENGTCGDVQDF
jgi:hypothetical protein